MDSIGGFADEEEQKTVLQTIMGLEAFWHDESIGDGEKVWITKKEARLLCTFIYSILHKACGGGEA